METKIVIFLAFASLTLIFNSIMLWFAYRAVSNTTTAMTKVLTDAQSSEDTRAWLQTLESASASAVALTDAAKTHLNNFEPLLARGQSKYEFKLAEFDIQLEKSVGTVVRQAQKMHYAVATPAYRFGETLSGIREVITYLSGEILPARSADDATSTPKR